MKMQIITLVKKEELNNEEYLVLAVCKGIGELDQEYVTWRCRKEEEENYYWGHYYQDIETALEDYNKRKGEN